MRQILECYKQLTEFIYNNVKDDAVTPQPLYQYIDIWNEQVDFFESENPFDFPACFIDFNFPEVNQMGLYSITLLGDITFYHAEVCYLDTYKGVAEGIDAGAKYFENLARLHEQLQAYTHESTGSLQFAGVVKYKTISNVICYGLKYHTTLVDNSSTVIKKKTETVTVDAELLIEKRPAGIPPVLPSGEKWFDLS